MCINSEQAIGIFDSGVGGLSVLKALRELMPQENFIYVADTLNAPYGERSNEFIESRVKSIAHFLAEQRVKLIVVACNTATAAAVKALRETYPFPIVGLEPALKPAVETSNNSRVGVLATRRTLESEKYQTLRARFCDTATIIEKASAYFVQLVESTSAGVIDENRILEELQPFIDAKVDSLVLGCTHFPFLSEVISRIMGPEVRLFESGLPVAKETARKLNENLNQSEQRGSVVYYSSAPLKALPVFNRLLGEQVSILPL